METRIWLHKEEASTVIGKMQEKLESLSVENEIIINELNNDFYIATIKVQDEEGLFWAGVAYARATY